MNAEQQTRMLKAIIQTAEYAFGIEGAVPISHAALEMMRAIEARERREK